MRISLARAGLFDVIFYKLWGMGLCSAHNQVTWRPEITRRIFLFHTLEFNKDLFRSLLAHNTHQITRRSSWRNIDHPLHVLGAYCQIFQTPAKGDADLRQPFR